MKKYLAAVELGWGVLLSGWFVSVYGAGQPPLGEGASVRLTSDYRYLIGSASYRDAEGDAEAGSTFRWLRDGVTLASGPVAEGLLLNFDETAVGANGESPALATRVQYANGRWGSALALPIDGRLRFSATTNLSLEEGTIELWVADAICLRSAARYNNGQPADRVRLQPMDGIVLARTQPVPIRPRLSQVTVSETNFLLTASDLTPGLIHELERSASLAPGSWTVRQSFWATDYVATIREEAPNTNGFYRLSVP